MQFSGSKSWTLKGFWRNKCLKSAAKSSNCTCAVPTQFSLCLVSDLSCGYCLVSKKTKQNKTKKQQSYGTTMSYVSLQLLHVMIGIFPHFNQKQKPKMLMHGYQVNMRTHMTWLLIARSNEVTDNIITDGSLKWPGAILIHSQNDSPVHIINYGSVFENDLGEMTSY